MAIYIFHKFCRLVLVSCAVVASLHVCVLCLYETRSGCVFTLFIIISAPTSLTFFYAIRFTVQIFNCTRLFYQHAYEFRLFEWSCWTEFSVFGRNTKLKRKKRRIHTQTTERNVHIKCICEILVHFGALSFLSFRLCHCTLYCTALPQLVGVRSFLSTALNIQQFDYY